MAPALEILEQPPSPVRMALILIICALVVVALGWTYVGRLDIIATADGKIEPRGQVKVVQPMQTGQVSRLLVLNGDRVMAGQTLVELDATDAKAQLIDLVEQLQAARAEVERRRAAVAAVTPLHDGSRSITTPAVTWSADIPAIYRDRETGVLEEDLVQLDAELASSESQIAQKNVDAQAIAATIAAQQSLVQTLADLASMRETLVSKEAGSKADWLDALETLKTQQVELSTDLSEQADNNAAIDVLRQEEAKSLGDFLADYMQKLAEAEKSAEDLEQKVAQARSQLAEMALHSPIDGVVQASAVTTVGQVLSSGEQVMRIVPANAAIDIQAYLPNDDVGFVQVGQPVTIKVNAFPYTEYGTVSGRVTAVGKDAVTAADAQQSLDSDASAAASTTLAGAADSTDNLVFPISVALDTPFITVGGKPQPLSPGMSVVAEINTGSRRILEYLFSPVVDVGVSAMHER